LALNSRPGVCWEEEGAEAEDKEEEEEEEAAARRLLLPLRAPGAEALAAAASCPAALKVIPLPGAAETAAEEAPCALAIAAAGVLDASNSSSSDGEGFASEAAAEVEAEAEALANGLDESASHSSSSASLGSDSTLPAPVLSSAATKGVREAARPFGVVTGRSELRRSVALEGEEEERR
jgi:hypothetical protein